MLDELEELLGGDPHPTERDIPAHKRRGLATMRARGHAKLMRLAEARRRPAPEGDRAAL